MVYLCMVNDILLSRGDETPGIKRKPTFRDRAKRKSERRASSEDEEGVSSLTCRWGPAKEIKRKPTFRDREKGMLRA